MSTQLLRWHPGGLCPRGVARSVVADAARACGRASLHAARL